MITLVKSNTIKRKENHKQEFRMSIDNDYFLKLVTAAIHDKKAPVRANADWNQIYNWSNEQSYNFV